MPRTPTTKQHVPSLLLLLLALGGCAGKLEDLGQFQRDGGASSGACFDIPSALFAPRCATGECHSSAAKAGMLDLEAPDVESRVLGVPSVGGTTGCEGTLVDPSHPGDSILYVKLTDQYCGKTKMPQVGTPLTGPELSCVWDWIMTRPFVPSEGSEGEGGGEAGGGDGGMGGAGGMAGTSNGEGGGGGICLRPTLRGDTWRGMH